MTKRLLLFILSVIMMTGIEAMAQTDKERGEPISTHKLKKMDKRFTKQKAQKRAFRTQKEFERMKQKRVAKHHRPDHSVYGDRGYEERGRTHELYYNRGERHHPARQRGERDTKRGWFLAYRYDRASFYDQNGYHYGYFNRYGYYFEDVFYRYDRYYSYHNRVRGRGLFDRRYYMPADYRYYGFCKSKNSRRHYRR